MAFCYGSPSLIIQLQKWIQILHTDKSGYLKEVLQLDYTKVNSYSSLEKLELRKIKSANQCNTTIFVLRAKPSTLGKSVVGLEGKQCF